MTTTKRSADPASPPATSEPADPKRTFSEGQASAASTRDQEMTMRRKRAKDQQLPETPAFTAQDWQDTFKAQDRAALEYNRERLLNQFPGLQLVLKPKA